MKLSSSFVNGPVRLLRSCSAPMILPLLFFIGMQRMLCVRYPVALSTSGLNRGSKYASGIFRVSPVAATYPAIPFSSGAGSRYPLHP